ncbi:hypothetical protein FE257_007275 [Aspergillus nanangensis]|uniref:Uncharacterized protein n=1 Tax=Aspergillus nanangensis TaxID=2582783 RepID=A0AAD4CN22_ASPNN|nr:hypothetical protein FE257_007275 [Aspergillus nanangensis]
MDCIRQIVRLVKSPFRRTSHRVLEIGPPMNFRKEELPSFFCDDDSETLHSHGSTPEKHVMVHTVDCHPSSTTEKIRTQVRRLSVKGVQPLPDHD